MTGTLVIREQRHPTLTGETPLTFGVFLETSEPIEGLEHWQDCKEVFVCYSWTPEGAQRAIAELQRLG